MYFSKQGLKVTEIIHQKGTWTTTTKSPSTGLYNSSGTEILNLNINLARSWRRTQVKVSVQWFVTWVSASYLPPWFRNRHGSLRTWNIKKWFTVMGCVETSRHYSTIWHRILTHICFQRIALGTFHYHEGAQGLKCFVRVKCLGPRSIPRLRSYRKDVSFLMMVLK